MSATGWSQLASQVAFTLVSTACLAAGVSACGAGLANNPCGAAARVPLAPAGVYVDEDVASGYVAYAGALASSGEWSGDARYGVHWCPARPGEGQAFRPYLSSGHWTTSDREAYGASPGTPYWTSDDAAPWTEITTHQGWWIDLGGADWCWVPGVQETPARVVWRSGDGFVGWAPEPPAWVDDGDDNASVGFEWEYELLGTLLEAAVEGYVLGTDAARDASEATSRSRQSGGSGAALSRRAPAKPVVARARSQLVAYALAHPREAPSSAAGASSRSAWTSPARAGTYGSKDTDRLDTDAAKALAVADRLPRSASGSSSFHAPGHVGTSARSFPSSAHVGSSRSSHSSSAGTSRTHK